VILKNDPDFKFAGDCMEFYLTYDGPLGSNSRAEQKHQLRRAFHPQLKHLWEISRHLKELREPLIDSAVTVNRPSDRSRIASLPERFACGPYKLVPLVTKDLDLACSLEILFLRPDYPGGLLQSGDIDNRLKTLFDGLRIPGPDAKELGGCTPLLGENPLYCLLEDDSLITHVSVKTDTLLELNTDSSHVRLVIDVRLQPVVRTIANLGF
jgi:hypothetical protein